MTQGFESFLDTAQYIYTIIFGKNQDIFTNFHEKIFLTLYVNHLFYTKKERKISPSLPICRLSFNSVAISAPSLLAIFKEEIDEIVENYIDFYINKRISLSLGGLTPKQYYDNYIKNTKRLTN